MNRAWIRSFQITVIMSVMIFPPATLLAQAKKPADAPDPATALQSGKMGEQSTEFLRQVDSNHDGFISQTEWTQFFAKQDQNGDKLLSLDEMKSSSPQSNGEGDANADAGRLAAFARLDANRNDAIDKAEWPGKSKDFRYLDANRNNSLSREEFLARNGRWWNETFDNLDFNGDGAIVRSEWLDSEATFKKLDRNRNGAIERREFYNPR